MRQPREPSGENEELVHRVAQRNVLRNVARIRAESPLLKELEAQGRIRILGAMYDMGTGVVTLLEEPR